MTQYNYTACPVQFSKLYWACPAGQSLDREPKTMLYIQQKSISQNKHAIQENGGVIVLG